MITSASNQGLKKLGNLLAKKKERDRERVYVCEGRKMFLEILHEEPELFVKIYISEAAYGEMEETDRELISGLPFELVADAVFEKAADTITPQGYLAIVRRKEYRLTDLVPENGEKRRLILLETLQDPGNLGTIIRTAEAAGMDGVILSRDSVDVWNPKVVRATMGAINRVPIVYAEEFGETLKTLKMGGMKLFAAALDGSIPYQEADYGSCYGILIGNEANGLKKETCELSDVRIRIPMEGRVESLNAAIACAVICYRARY